MDTFLRLSHLHALLDAGAFWQATVPYLTFMTPPASFSPLDHLKTCARYIRRLVRYTKINTGDESMTITDSQSPWT